VKYYEITMQLNQNSACNYNLYYICKNLNPYKMETIVDTAINLNNVEFVTRPVQNFHSVDNSLLLMGLVAVFLFVYFKDNLSIGYNKYICKLK
jgi:hypothetical protein